MFSPILHDAYIQATVDERLRRAELRRVSVEVGRSRPRDFPVAAPVRPSRIRPRPALLHRH